MCDCNFIKSDVCMSMLSMLSLYKQIVKHNVSVKKSEYSTGK